MGERGPERFVPDVPGKIIPNSALGGGDRTTVNNNFNVDMRGASVEAMIELRRLVQRVNGSIESRSVNAVVDARRRNPNLFR